MDAIIEIIGLSFSYDQKTALRSISMNCRENTLQCILGPNGSGKTTLFRILSTLVDLQKGIVKINGFDLTRQVREIRKVIGVVFQSPCLDMNLTVRENLRHFGHLHGMFGGYLNDCIQRVLIELEISDRAEDLVEELSGGLRRRVDLARGLLPEPVILFMDEPTSGLDIAARKNFWTVINRIRQDRGLTILFTTHIIAEAEDAEMIAILDNGKLICHDTPDALQREIQPELITLSAEDPEQLAMRIRKKYDIVVEMKDDDVCIRTFDGSTLLSRILDDFNVDVETASLSKSNISHVFLEKTGKPLAS